MRTSLLVSALVAASCGGGSRPAPTLTPETPVDPASAGAQDQVFEYAAFSVKGNVYLPGALGTPSMEFSIAVKRKTADQRKRYQKAKGADRFLEGHILAIMLWGEGKDASRAEARTVYKELVKDPAAPEEIIATHASVEQLLGDEAAAAAAYDLLVTRFATSAQAPVYRAHKAYYQLRGGDDNAAIATMAEVKPDAGGAAPVAYVAAWIHFRRGELDKAWSWMAAAAGTWTAPGLAELRRDVMLFGARGGAAPDEVVKLLEKLAKLDGARIAELTRVLADHYRNAGRWAERDATLAKLAEGAPPADRAELLYFQSDARYRLNDVDGTVDRALAAWGEAAAAKDIKPDVREALAAYLKNLGTVAHKIYVTSFDERWLGAARKLYQAYVAIPDRPDADEYRKRLGDLDEIAGNAEAKANGLHDQEIMKVRIIARLDDAVACYERVLQRAPTLAGTVKVLIDVSPDGKVGSVSPDPAPGDEGLGAVSRCLAERVPTWSFPSRVKPGLTRLVAPISFAPSTASK